MIRPVYRPLLSLFGVMFILSTACYAPMRPQTIEQPGPNQATQTVEALRTIIAGQNTVVTPSPGLSTTPTITETAIVPVPTQGPTATRQPGESTSQPSPTPRCDQAGFISDITIPDGTEMPSGTSFTKTWRLQNKGTCTWSSDYAVVFDSGHAMNGPSVQKIGVSIAPGQTADISVPLKAPGEPGTYKGVWKLRNAAGVDFGTGPTNSTFFVEIKVITPNTSAGGYDFIGNVCLAEWTGGDKSIPCIGQDGSTDGFVRTLKRPLLENGYVDDEKALLTNPPLSNDALIRGKYPSFTVKDGDHFRSIIGCEHNSKNCNVRFQLDYQIDGGAVQTLASWHEIYDEHFTPIDQDLSSLAGKTVRFILTVSANGASDRDRALWLLPRIENDR